MEVAVRELKDRLSELLRRAEAGEVIDVTSHGRPIVRILPVKQPRPAFASEGASSLAYGLRRGVDRLLPLK